MPECLTRFSFLAIELGNQEEATHGPHSVDDAVRRHRCGFRGVRAPRSLFYEALAYGAGPELIGQHRPLSVRA